MSLTKKCFNDSFLKLVLLFTFFLIGSCSLPHDELSLSSDVIKDASSPSEIVEEDTYAYDCHRSQFWFCPPLNAVWQMEVVVDICQTPPAVISVGECEEYFECDPSIYHQGEKDCTTEEGYPGEQSIYCNKGTYQYGECVSPCFEEVCDYVDNDCDGLIDEGQTNSCGGCGFPPEEICNGLDDDCDGETDEALVETCSTACDSGYQICTSGTWSNCTATAPQEETCNGIDDNCNGQIDEGLLCKCPAELVGALLPCGESPLTCGQGFKTCECLDPFCTKTGMTECFAPCVFMPIAEEVCDPHLGHTEEETCNNFDDDCDDLIDEDLHAECYSGSEETYEVGICQGGDITCVEGSWGSVTSEGFVANLCAEETTPQEEICNGVDDDCDGVTDYGLPMDPTDILLIIDMSGSMDTELSAVLLALQTFSIYYADEETLQWGLVLGPIVDAPCANVQCSSILDVCYEGACLSCGTWEDLLNACTVFPPGTPCHETFCVNLQSPGLFQDESLNLFLDLSNFSSFLGALSTASNLNWTSSGKEMLLDALYISVFPLSASAPYPLEGLTWENGVISHPPIAAFPPTWREDAKRVVILFTDEEPQSFLNPPLSNTEVENSLGTTSDLKLYTFTTETSKNDWSNLSQVTGGNWFKLSINSEELLANLLQILDENVCK